MQVYLIILYTVQSLPLWEIGKNILNTLKMNSLIVPPVNEGTYLLCVCIFFLSSLIKGEIFCFELIIDHSNSE
jgi:hypothetical protein